MSIVLEDNIFSNSADNGGGGGGEDVEVLENGYLGLKTDDTSLGYSLIMNIIDTMPIDEKNFLYYTYVAPGGYGSDTLQIRSSVTGGTVKNSISFSFGATYSNYGSIFNIFSISPNKDKVVISGINSNQNIYVVPLIKNGDDYSLGTPISYNVGSNAPFKCEWIDNNTFINRTSGATSLSVYKIENNEISLLKTISLSSNPNKIKVYNGSKIILLYTTKVEIMDYSTETIDFTYNSSTNLNSYILIYKNFAFFIRTMSPYYLVLDLEQLKEVSMSISVDARSLGGVQSALDNDYLELRDNGIVIARGMLTSGAGYSTTFIDFENKTIHSITMENGLINDKSYSKSIACFYYEKGKLFLGIAWQGNGLSGTWTYLDCPTKISYDGFDYSVTGQSASE